MFGTSRFREPSFFSISIAIPRFTSSCCSRDGVPSTAGVVQLATAKQLAAFRRQFGSSEVVVYRLAKDKPVKMAVLRQNKELTLEGSLPETGRRHIERRIVIKKDGDE